MLLRGNELTWPTVNLRITLKSQSEEEPNVHHERMCYAFSNFLI